MKALIQFASINKSLIILTFLDGKQRGLRVERVEDGFDQQQVHTPVEQGLDLLAVRLAKMIEAHGTEAGIVHLRREACGDGHRPDSAGHEAGLAGFIRDLVRCLPRELRRGEVHLHGNFTKELVGDDLFEEGLVFAARGVSVEKEVMLADGRGRERVRLDEVRASQQVMPVDVGDDLWTCELEQLVVALEWLALPVCEARPAEIRLSELALLNHRAHRAVEDDDALTQQSGEQCGSGRGGRVQVHGFDASVIAANLQNVKSTYRDL